MNARRFRHLEEEAVLRGVVDTGDLTEQERQHLSSCRACREKMLGLTRSLDTLSEKVEENLPPVPSLPRLPVSARENIRRFSRGLTDYRLWAGAMATALLAVVFLWMGTPNRDGSETPSLWRQTEAHMLFTAQESVQEELLPSKLAQLLEAESFTLDSEFMEFVAPFETSNGEPVQNGGIS